MNTWLDMALIEYYNYSGPYFLPSTLIYHNSSNLFADKLKSLPNIGWVFKDRLMHQYACAVPVDPHTRWHERIPKCKGPNLVLRETHCGRLHHDKNISCCGRELKEILEIQHEISKKTR